MFAPVVIDDLWAFCDFASAVKVEPISNRSALQWRAL
jgi:hypothetical protein